MQKLFTIGSTYTAAFFLFSKIFIFGRFFISFGFAFCFCSFLSVSFVFALGRHSSVTSTRVLFNTLINSKNIANGNLPLDKKRLLLAKTCQGVFDNTVKIKGEEDDRVKAMLPRAIFLATCNAILLLRDVN